MLGRASAIVSPPDDPNGTPIPGGMGIGIGIDTRAAGIGAMDGAMDGDIGARLSIEGDAPVSGFLIVPAAVGA